MPVTPASSVFAMLLTGDLGGYTFVQRAGCKRTQYAKTYPRQTPTGTQKIFRSRFALAVHAWQSLDTEHKHTLELIVEKHHMVMSGYNLFISCTLNHRTTWLSDWAEQLGRSW